MEKRNFIRHDNFIQKNKKAIG